MLNSTSSEAYLDPSYVNLARVFCYLQPKSDRCQFKPLRLYTVCLDIGCKMSQMALDSTRLSLSVEYNY